MYRLEWADGMKSEDMYNFTRAWDILNNYDYYRNLTRMMDIDASQDASQAAREAH